MKFLILNGPNLNLLGLREPELYGKQDYAALCTAIETWCREAGVEYEMIQSNHEGVLVDAIQNAWFQKVDGIILNPAAYTHTSIAILDALKAVQIPTVEVHLTDIQQREDFRHISYPGMACIKTFQGLGLEGYHRAILFLREYLQA